VAGIVAALLAATLLLQWVLKPMLLDQIRANLQEELGLVKELAIQRGLPDRGIQRTDVLADRIGRALSRRVTFIAVDGRVLGDSNVSLERLPHVENHRGRPEVEEALRRGVGWHIRRSATIGAEFLYVASVLGDTEAPRLILRLAVPLQRVEGLLRRMRELVVLAAVASALLSFGLAYLVSRGISRPVAELTRAAKRLAAGDRTARIGRYPQNELGELARSFDRMADVLQEELEAVERARDRLSAVLEGMAEGVMLLDVEGRIVLWNRALEDLLRLELEPRGRTPAELVRSPELQEAVREILEGEEQRVLEVRTSTRPQRILEVHLGRILGREGGAVAVFHDVTEQRRVEKVRRDFVANVSHELRTPLSAIRAAVETLLEGALMDPKFSHHFVEVIGRHTERLQRLLDDLLDLARIESGHTPPSMEPIRADALMDAAAGTVASLAQSRGVELIREPTEEPLVIRGDRRQLEQALVNLLDNAVKYTDPPGRVVLSIRRRDREVHLEVSDTGVGIPEEHIPRIFERFYRVDKARSRQLGGTGLGLAIVKHIVQAHGGRVEVESTPGKGSTFRVVLPG